MSTKAVKSSVIRTILFQFLQRETSRRFRVDSWGTTCKLRSWVAFRPTDLTPSLCENLSANAEEKPHKIWNDDEMRVQEDRVRRSERKEQVLRNRAKSLSKVSRQGHVGCWRRFWSSATLRKKRRRKPRTPLSFRLEQEVFATRCEQVVVGWHPQRATWRFVTDDGRQMRGMSRCVWTRRV